MGGSTNKVPIVSKIFCSSSLTSLMVRKRPRVVSGGGFVVTDCSQNAIFAVDGCGTLGAKGELMLKDGDGEHILFIRKKVRNTIRSLATYGMHACILVSMHVCIQCASLCYQGGIVQALSTRNKWNGYLMDDEGVNKLIFSLTDPKSCLAMNNSIRIRVDHPKGHNKDLDFEVHGSFADKSCTIRDCRGNVVAQV